MHLADSGAHKRALDDLLAIDSTLNGQFRGSPPEVLRYSAVRVCGGPLVDESWSQIPGTAPLEPGEVH